MEDAVEEGNFVSIPAEELVRPAPPTLQFDGTWQARLQGWTHPGISTSARLSGKSGQPLYVREDGQVILASLEGKGHITPTASISERNKDLNCQNWETKAPLGQPQGENF
ncbi:hypothetical protein PoB_007432100 [Plakobranchus ocellatus]|uniref:Uncharacterized protein n=1 Tax=Plakobranchus ocellatus TaxID=259542 RepID=A0AAV4DV77_9GAST|nr:hypothetical protein PoB_007432100 [Plakobranchus ocellatus]